MKHKRRRLHPLDVVVFAVLAAAIAYVAYRVDSVLVYRWDWSLVALISIQELSFLAMEIAISEQRFFEVWIFTGCMYFVVCYSLALVFNRLERRMGTGRG